MQSENKFSMPISCEFTENALFPGGWIDIRYRIIIMLLHVLYLLLMKLKPAKLWDSPFNRIIITLVGVSLQVMEVL